MTHHCPVCQRSFAEPGFCPFDGKQLVDKVTSGIHPTLLSTIETDAEKPPATTPGVGEANKLLAISAHEGHAAVLDKIRSRSNEYDRLVGETLDGRYFVQRKIGEGGMGVVFAVKHAVIERPLAIKVLKREVMRDGAVIQRFIQEAKAASRIGHPNIVDVTDFGKTPEGMTYSVMEFVDGTTLSKTIKNAAPLPAERVARIASQIARALAAAHAKGIIHRDLKPENVFLIDRDGRPDFVKIVDFGIAKVQPVEGADAGPRLTRAGSVFGTPEYMAPEQASGKGDIDPRVDVYALGVIMYEMLAGKVPHKGESMIRTIAMQMLDPIVPPNKANPELRVPPALEAIVMKALEKDREQRFASMTALLTALEEIQPALAIQAALPPLPPGADADLAASPGAKSGGPARRPKPSTRPLHEPEFVAAPVSFSHVYDDADDEPAPEKPRWPLWLAGLLVLLVGAGGMVLLISKLGSRGGGHQVSAPGDAARVVEAPPDAGTDETPVHDAGAIAELPPDGGDRVIATVERDAGVQTVVQPNDRPNDRPSDRPIDRPIDRKGRVTIEVLTRPGEANVFIAPNFRGPSGVKLTEPYGTKRHIECKTDRLKGSVDIVFDGKVTAVMCTATRDRFCVPGLKNPYDDCEQEE